MRKESYYPKSGTFNYRRPGRYQQANLRPFLPIGDPYAWRTKKEKIRDPVKYLTQKHKVPKRYAKEFLAQPAVIKQYWKEDNSGLYVDKEMLDSIGYGWLKERKEFMESLESTEKVREASRKAMKKDYGKILSEKEMEAKIEEMPLKYQTRLRKTQRVMKIIKK